MSISLTQELSGEPSQGRILVQCYLRMCFPSDDMTVNLGGLNELLVHEKLQKNIKLIDRSKVEKSSTINVPSSFNFSIKETQIDRPV